ncbi:MAG: hypothetical protein CMJ48_01510, partial [Planctomycetaceae bacterium]|nr:hypothetical protein [Planctomycetaceae bacterium]
KPPPARADDARLGDVFNRNPGHHTLKKTFKRRTQYSLQPGRRPIATFCLCCAGSHSRALGTTRLMNNSGERHSGDGRNPAVEV